MSTSTRQRLCIVTPMHSASHEGGAEYQIDRFIDVLRAMNRYDIYYLSSVLSGESKSDRYRVVQVGRESRPPRFGYLAVALPLYHALREIRPSAIYQRVACGFTGVCAYYARRNRAKLIWHVAHDSDVTPKASLDGRNPVRRFLEKRSVEYGIRRATCIVTQTQDQASLLERNYHRRADAIIPNFHPQPTEAIDKSGPTVVAWVASIKPWKRPEAFLNLAAALRDRQDVRFVMIGAGGTGSGEHDWSQQVLGRARAASNVEYLGARSQAEVNQVLARSHIFVNTSRYEGFPNTFIQAWMREVPVVSLHVDPDRLLMEREIGVFCNDDEALLAQTVARLVAQPALRAHYAARAREYALSRHSMANASGLAQLVETCGAAA